MVPDWREFLRGFWVNPCLLIRRSVRTVLCGAVARGDSLARTLLGLPWYRGHIDGEQEVMIGYSDSAKDAGRMAAAWAQYRAQVGGADGLPPREREGERVFFFLPRGWFQALYRGARPTRGLRGWDIRKHPPPLPFQWCVTA